MPVECLAKQKLISRFSALYSLSQILPSVLSWVQLSKLVWFFILFGCGNGRPFRKVISCHEATMTTTNTDQAFIFSHFLEIDFKSTFQFLVNFYIAQIVDLTTRRRLMKKWFTVNYFICIAPDRCFSTICNWGISIFLNNTVKDFAQDDLNKIQYLTRNDVNWICNIRRNSFWQSFTF